MVQETKRFLSYICPHCMQSVIVERDLFSLAAAPAHIKCPCGKSELRVDGGASANNFLMQFQSDIMDRPLRRPKIRETTALGAAYLAGLATGVWKSLEDIRGSWTLDRLYQPAMEAEQRSRLLRGWHEAVDRVRSK